MGESNEERIIMRFNELLADLKQLKPNDRSGCDRYWAIAKTEVEKAYAIFVTFAREEKKETEPT